MNHLPISSSNRLHYRLAHGRMRMDGFDDLMSCGFEFSGDNYFGDHFSYIVSDHMGPEPFTVFFIKDHLDKAVF